MTRDDCTFDHTNRRTILHALGGLAATGALVGTSAAALSSSDEIEFSDLDNESKTIFKQLLAGNDIMRQGSQLPTDLLIHDHVRYEGSVYRIQRSYSKESGYHVAFDETSRDSIAERVARQIGSNADTVDQHLNAEGKLSVRELSPPARQVLTLERDRTSLKELPQEFIENTYIEVDGTLYRILAGHSDVTAVTFAATNTQ
jgi:hypothetical protein